MDSTATKKTSRSLFKVNALLLVAVVLLVVSPLILFSQAEFVGSDEQAEQIITEMNAEYQPWFQPLWEPPSGEIESLLFAVQAALGAGFIGYYLGYQRGKRKAAKNQDVLPR